MRQKRTQRPPIQRIQTDPDRGLTAANVQERIDKGYVNIAADPNEKSTLHIIASNLFTFFNTVLFSIALLFIGFMIYLTSIGRSDIVDTYFGFSRFLFLLPAIMNVGMGSFQEIKSLKVIKRLRIVTSTKSKVVRDGSVTTIEANQIVLDDVIVLSAGEQATADMIVLSGEVDVDESMLTGESDYIRKKAGDTILSGSSIIVGNARGRAEKIGNETYAAELTRKVKSGANHKSELMTSIMKIIKILTVGLVISTAVITATMVYKVIVHGSDPTVWGGLTLSLTDPVTWALIILTDGMFGSGIIPSGLVLTTSVALMVSIAQLTKKQTLVQELYSLENLSRVDIICLDKTGTLTDGSMSVCDVKFFLPEEEVRRHVRQLVAASEDRNATAEAIFQYFGTETHPYYREVIPFSSANKYSGLVYHDSKKLLMGAPEYLLPAEDEHLSYVTDHAAQGHRVVAVTLDGVLIALIAIEDHIRDTAPDTLKFFRENGVTVKVISGDNPLTVSRIAQKCGIENADKYISLADVPLEQIPALAEKYTIFARVSPEQKEALVMALQSKGHKVAMTGDGVNDILALRRSDSSITFAKATEAAKSCSDVVLLDNDFSHLKEVVGEGRRVIGNIEKTTVLYLMKSIALFLFVFVLIPFAKGQMWFSIENMYMLEAAVIGTGGFLLSLEPIRKPFKGSFLRNIALKSISAGTLTVCAIVLPIMLNTVPKFFGMPPFVTDGNVQAMMTVLTSIAGLVVVFSMCIPFNRYRAFALGAILFVVIVLGLLLPSSFIGGRPINGPMLAFDTAAGQHFYDAPLFQEMFRPMNSEIIRALLADQNNYIVLRLFLYIAIPTFILIRFAVENFTDGKHKIRKGNQPFRIGRRLMLSSGFVLTLHAVLTTAEVVSLNGYTEQLNDALDRYMFIGFYLIYAALHIAIGIIGYRVWNQPSERSVRWGFIAGVLLFFLTALPAIFSGSLFHQGNIALTMDSIVMFVITIGYSLGSVLVWIRFDPALAPPAAKNSAQKT